MKLTLDDVVSLTSGKLIREGSVGEIAGLGALDEAGSNDVSFLGNEKYYQDFLQTKAGIVIIPPNVPDYPADAALIEVENPSLAFGEVIKHFAKSLRAFKAGVHPAAYVADDVSYDPESVSIKAGAVVEAGVKIGAGTEIGPGACIGAGVSIGEDCLIHANATVREGCVLGDRVILQPSCVIGSDGFGYALVDGKHEKIDQVGIVVLEDDVEIGSNSTIDRARFGKTVIGQGTKIDNLVQVGHNVTMGKHCLIISQVGISGSSHLGDYVTVAGQAGIAGHLKITDKVTLVARAGATKDISKEGFYMGMPARPMREELKKQAQVTKIPKILDEMKALKKQLAGESSAE